MRSLNSPNASIGSINAIIPVAKGGTGTSNVSSVSANLAIVSKSMLGVAGGVLKQEVGGGIVPSALPSSIAAKVTLDGPTIVYQSQVVQYLITNYDASSTYNVSCSVGSISRTGNTITYTAPTTAGVGTITVNNRTVNVTVSAYSPLTPTITSPINGSVNVMDEVTLTASAYQAPPAITSSSQYSADWEIATDIGFTNVVKSSTNDTVNLNSCSLSGLTANTTYYARVRYSSQVFWINSTSYRGNVSQWSTAITFTTRASFLNATEEACVISGDRVAGDNFGRSIVISGDGTRIAVGSPGRTTNTGVVYIFLRSAGSWVQEAKLTASDAATGDYFAYWGALGINFDGSRLVVGAGSKTGTYSLQGAIYVFSRTGTTWSQEAKLLEGDVANGDYFGSVVAINYDGTRIISGSYNKAGTYAAQGAAYIYLRTGTTWAQEAKLLAGDPAANDYFGSSVSISNDGSRVAIGAYNKLALASQGAAYIYLRSGTTWGQEAKLLIADPAANDYFGKSISLSGDGTRVAVSTYNKTVTVAAQGAVYTFARNLVTSNWIQEAKIVHSDPVASDYFGYSISMNNDGSKLLVGCYGKLTNTGAVYTFNRTYNLWTQTNKITASNAITNAYFGYSINMSNDGSRLAVGSYGNTINNVATVGCAYIYN